jgi:UDP-N-acetylglucosamine acyltransferase
MIASHALLERVGGARGGREHPGGKGRPMKIHPSAKVHPSCVLEGEDIEIGAGTTIDALCYLKGPIVIGENSRLYPHCVVGTDAEHQTLTTQGLIRIGSRSVIRELSVLQRGTGDRDTTVGDDCYIMDHVHIAHDVVLGSSVTVAPNTVFAGHCRVGDGATIGLNVSVHQFSTIGSYAMVGMGTVVNRDVPPFAMVVGAPASFVRLNAHPMTRLGIPVDQMVIEDGVLTSKHPVVTATLEKFARDRRANRQTLLLAPKPGKDS